MGLPVEGTPPGLWVHDVVQGFKQVATQPPALAALTSFPLRCFSLVLHRRPEALLRLLPVEELGAALGLEL